MIKNKYVALGYRIFCFATALAGLRTQIGTASGSIKFKHFMYYTIQSNLLALVLFGMLIYKTVTDIRKNGKTGNTGYFPRFEMVCVIDLFLTLLVYWVLLVPSTFTMDITSSIWSFGNMAVHLFVPLLCLIDYFLFSRPGHLKYRDVYYVLIFPLSYVLFSTAAGLLGYVYQTSIDGRNIRFPYFFFDWDELGAKAILYILALVIFFLILSHILYGIDKKWAKKQAGK